MSEKPPQAPNWRLRHARVRYGLSQKQVADAVGTGAAMVSRWEGGMMKPGPYFRQKLCTLFGQTAEELGFLTAFEAPLASHGAREGLWSVPLRRNLFFTGRESVIQQVYHALHTGGPVARTQALSGLGGMGKTQTALEYAYRFREYYQAILWVPAETRHMFTASVAALASVLNLPEQHESDQRSAIAAVQRWLASNTDWLLILDNQEELELVEEMVPLGKGHTLMTTQAQATGTVAGRIELLPLPVEEGALFLLRRAKVLAPDASLDQAPVPARAAAEAIATLLDGLPLALDQAGAYIEETHCGIEGYLARLQTHQGALLQRRGKAARNHPASVTTTFALAFQRVEQANPAAANLLRLCSFLHPEAIPEELFTSEAIGREACWNGSMGDPLALDAALEALGAFSLMQRDPQSKTLWLHRLVQAVVQETLDPQAQQQWMACALAAIGQVAPEVQATPWSQIQRFLPQVLNAARWSERTELELPAGLALLDKIGQYCSQLAEYPQAERAVQRALALRERALGLMHPDMAISLNTLAILYRVQGRYTEALPCFQRALAIREQTLGPTHPLVAQSLNTLANLYWVQGQFTQALPCFQRALTIREQTLGPTHPDLAISLSNLANLYQVQGQSAKALPLYQRALAILEQALGAEHPHVAAALNNLAKLHHDQGRFAEALPLYQRSLRIWEQALGPTHPDVATSLNNLATLYQTQGQFAEALPLAQRALKLREHGLGPDHPLVAESLHTLAKLCQDQGHHRQALSLAQRSLAILERVMGPAHPMVAESLHTLATFYQAQGQSVKALPLYERAVKIYEQALPDHPNTAAYRKHLAALLR